MARESFLHLFCSTVADCDDKFSVARGGTSYEYELNNNSWGSRRIIITYSCNNFCKNLSDNYNTMYNSYKYTSTKAYGWGRRDTGKSRMQNTIEWQIKTGRLRGDTTQSEKEKWVSKEILLVSVALSTQQQFIKLCNDLWRDREILITIMCIRWMLYTGRSYTKNIRSRSINYLTFRTQSIPILWSSSVAYIVICADWSS